MPLGIRLLLDGTKRMALIETQREQAAYDTGFDNGKDYWENNLIERLIRQLKEHENQAVKAGDYQKAWLTRRLIMITKDLTE